ncbi:MAG: hypothetical protein JJU37_14160 [Balneolaceae bacterium]|nr:hypothetical protein [Balneolaceae bacterium]
MKATLFLYTLLPLKVYSQATLPINYMHMCAQVTDHYGPAPEAARFLRLCEEEIVKVHGM